MMRFGDYLERLQETTSVETVVRQLQASGEDIGFENMLLGGWQFQPDTGNPGPSVLTNYDASWMKASQEGRYKSDPILRHAHGGGLFTWDKVKILTPDERTFMSDARDAIGDKGISATLPGSKGRLGAVSFCSKDNADQDMDLAQERLFARAAAAHLRILEIEFSEKLDGVVMTPKEMEVLTLLAVPSLTLDDIADRLKVASSTVATHADNIRTKLQVNNRVGVMVAALNCGLIGIPDEF